MESERWLRVESRKTCTCAIEFIVFFPFSIWLAILLTHYLYSFFFQLGRARDGGVWDPKNGFGSQLDNWIRSRIQSELAGCTKLFLSGKGYCYATWNDIRYMQFVFHYILYSIYMYLYAFQKIYSCKIICINLFVYRFVPEIPPHSTTELLSELQ